MSATLVCIAVLTSYDPWAATSTVTRYCAPAPRLERGACVVPAQGSLPTACMCRLNPDLKGCDFG